MTTATRTTAVGVFTDRDQADQAVAELRRAGFASDQVQLTAKPATAGQDTPGASGPPNWETGAGYGLLAGACLGAVGGPAGMLALGVGGMLIGALIDLGIPETDARFYSDQVEAGYLMVTVRADNRYDQAQAILHHCGALPPPESTEASAAELGP
jgi:hypothetical protein